MTQSERQAVKEPVPDWWAIGVLAVFFGAPMMLLFGAALLRNPPVIIVLSGLFAVSTWWYIRKKKSITDLRQLPPPPLPPAPVAGPEPAIPAIPTLDVSGWVPWAAIEVRHTRAHPLRVESSFAKDALLEALATRLPPLDTDLRFTSNIAKQGSGRWIDVDDAGERARLSLHIDGYSVPGVIASAGIDGVVESDEHGCSLDLWIRPSAANRAAAILIGLLQIGLALGLFGGAVGSVAKGEPAGALVWVALGAGIMGIGIGMIRVQRRLTTRLVDELVAIVEHAAASTALTPPEAGERRPAPSRVMTTTEREVYKAATQVRIGQSPPSAGCLPTAAVVLSGTLLILGSIRVLIAS